MNPTRRAIYRALRRMEVHRPLAHWDHCRLECQCHPGDTTVTYSIDWHEPDIEQIRERLMELQGSGPDSAVEAVEITPEWVLFI